MPSEIEGVIVIVFLAHCSSQIYFRPNNLVDYIFLGGLSFSWLVPESAIYKAAWGSVECRNIDKTATSLLITPGIYTIKIEKNGEKLNLYTNTDDGFAVLNKKDATNAESIKNGNEELHNRITLTGNDQFVKIKVFPNSVIRADSVASNTTIILETHGWLYHLPDNIDCSRN